MAIRISAKRARGVECGVDNAIDTVMEKAMTKQEVYVSLRSFVADGLNCVGCKDDTPTDTDMEYARQLWPFEHVSLPLGKSQL